VSCRDAAWTEWTSPGDGALPSLWPEPRATGGATRDLSRVTAIDRAYWVAVGRRQTRDRDRDTFRFLSAFLASGVEMVALLLTPFGVFWGAEGAGATGPATTPRCRRSWRS
jgi:hypothetical protein